MMNDTTWIVPAITAIGTIIASVVAAILAYMASKNAKFATESAEAAKAQAAKTATAVDGRMTELLELTRKNAASEAKEEEQAAEHGRKVAIAYATEVAPPVQDDGADQHLLVAEEKARKLLEVAAIKAAQLLKDSRKPRG